MSEENKENQEQSSQEQSSIMVPIDDLDKVSEDAANTVDQLARNCQQSSNLQNVLLSLEAEICLLHTSRL